MTVRALRAWLWVLAAVAVLAWTGTAWVGAAMAGQASDAVAWLEAPLSGMSDVLHWLHLAGALVERIGAPLIWGLWLAGVLLAGAGTVALHWLLGNLKPRTY